MLQLLITNPQLAVLDELDSGLDVDSMKVLAQAVDALRGPDFSLLLITHYQRLLNYITPDVVHIIADGKIVSTGDGKLANEIEQKGYQWLVAQ